MKKISNFIVEKRHLILSVMLILTVLSAIWIPSVKINKNLTKYLPDDSLMRKGLDIMENEFPDVPMEGSIRVMFKDLKSEEIPEIQKQLEKIEYVSSVMHQNNENYEKPPYTLFEVQTNHEYGTKEEQQIEEQIQSLFKDRNMVFQHSVSNLLQIPVYIYLIIVAVLLLILFCMCSSYLEPFLFLFTIGIAIVINMGTNAFFENVAETTYTLSSVLQLALSMDYSIILMNRYRQEREHEKDKKEAMKNAYRAAFPSIISSGLTTVLGLVMLIFMRFKIGLDLGRVMAKGVAISMMVVLTVLPCLILLFEKGIEKTKKKELPLKTKWLASFNFKGRKILAAVFALLFLSTALLQGLSKVTFAQPKDQTIEKVFKQKNPIVVLFDNEDRQAMGKVSSALRKEEKTDLVFDYYSTAEIPLSSLEMTVMVQQFLPSVQMKKELIDFIYVSYFTNNPNTADGKISLETFIKYLKEDFSKREEFAAFIDEQMKMALERGSAMLKEMKKSTVGEEHSILLISTGLEEESKETTAFIENLETMLGEHCENTCYLMGNSPMNVELERGFQKDLWLITGLSVLSIFIIVALTFRSLSIPLILVLIVQCGIYFTVLFSTVLGRSVYYLSLLVVQCILMGATIDYGIVFTNYYIEKRKMFEKKEALEETFRESIHTVLTSSLIIILITGIIGICPADPAITEICQTISIGTASVLLLILFVLPGLLCCFDKTVTKEKKPPVTKSQKKEEKEDIL